MEEAANMPSSTQEFCLRWNNFHASLVSAIDGFKNDSDFVDVTLACEGQFIQAHKMLLSACSVFFRDLLKANPCQHPIVILPPDVQFGDLEKMLRFIYQGEVNVQQEHLARFLKTAEMLKIRGLVEDNEKQKILPSSSSAKACSSEGSESERSVDNVSVIPKRPRLSVDPPSCSISEVTQTTNDENSQGSGLDSDSEMIPVKQEMIEFKECDFENVECESLFSDTLIKITSATTSSSDTSSSTHPAPPPPPGLLLPSYVPPTPQVKSQDDLLSVTCQEEISQGLIARLAPEPSEARCEGEGTENPGSGAWTLASTPKSSLGSSTVRRFVLPRTSSGSGKNFASTSSRSSPAGSTTSSPASPHPSSLGDSPSIPSPASNKSISLKRSPAQRCSPVLGASSGFAGALPSTGTSLSIWHPPLPPLQKDENQLSTSENVSFVVVPTSSSGIGHSVQLSCDICQKTFTSRSNLNKHKRVQHSGEEYMCPICKRTFKNRYYIKDHVNLCAFPNKKSPSNSRSSLEPSPNSHPSFEPDQNIQNDIVRKDEWLSNYYKNNDHENNNSAINYSKPQSNATSPGHIKGASNCSITQEFSSHQEKDGRMQDITDST